MIDAGRAGSSFRSRRGDIIAGLSVAGLILPEAVAYAGIAGLPPQRAIIAAVVGGLAYLAVGRSRIAIIAPTSSSAAILAATLVSLGPAGLDSGALATAVIGLAGCAFLLMAFFRLGGVASFVSRPVLHGFALGLAITIIVRQLPTLLGLKVGGSDIFALISGIASNIGQINGFSAAIGVASLAALLILRRYTHWPATLIVLAVGILATSLLDLGGHGVALVGPIPLVIATPSLPAMDLATWSRIAQLALPLALVLFAESWGTMRTLALRHGDLVFPNRELLALGFANAASALAGGLPVGAGFSAGSANDSAGASSKLSAFAAIIGVVALISLAAPLVTRIPEPVLAAVVIAALSHALAPAPFVRLFRIGRDQWIALAAALGVILLGVLNGMLAAIALSVAVLLRRMSMPIISRLGRLSDSHDFVDLGWHPNATPVPNAAIFRPNAPLFFGNADVALGQVAQACASLSAGTAVILSLEESDDLDSSAVEALADLARVIRARGLTLHLARLHDRARGVLIAAGMAPLADGAGFSVADTVSALGRPS